MGFFFMEFPGREAAILIERQRAFKRCASVRANFARSVFGVRLRLCTALGTGSGSKVGCVALSALMNILESTSGRPNCTFGDLLRHRLQEKPIHLS
jgi:hypothetical protein